MQHVAPADFGIDIQCDDKRWHPHLVLVETRLGALAETLGLPEHGEVSVKLTDDRQISELNRGFRDKSGATNVLSFPALDFTAPSEQNDFPKCRFHWAISCWLSTRWLLRLMPQTRILRTIWCICWFTGFCIFWGYDHQNEADAARMETRESTYWRASGWMTPIAQAMHQQCRNRERQGRRG